MHNPTNSRERYRARQSNTIGVGGRVRARQRGSREREIMNDSDLEGSLHSRCKQSVTERKSESLRVREHGRGRDVEQEQDVSHGEWERARW